MVHQQRVLNEIKRYECQLYPNQIYLNQKYCERDPRSVKQLQISRNSGTFKYILDVYNHYFLGSICHTPQSQLTNCLDILEDIDTRHQSTDVMIDLDLKMHLNIESLLGTSDVRLINLRARNSFIKQTISSYAQTKYVLNAISTSPPLSPKITTHTTKEEKCEVKFTSSTKPIQTPQPQPKLKRYVSLKQLNPNLKARDIIQRKRSNLPMHLNVLSIEEQHSIRIADKKDNNPPQRPKHKSQLSQHFNTEPSDSKQQPYIPLDQKCSENYSIQRRLPASWRLKSLETDIPIKVEEEVPLKTSNENIKAFFKQYFHKDSRSNNTEVKFRLLVSRTSLGTTIKHPSKQMTVMDTIRSYNSIQLHQL